MVYLYKLFNYLNFFISCLFIYIFIYLFIYLFVYLSIYLALFEKNKVTEFDLSLMIILIQFCPRAGFPQG